MISAWSKRLVSPIVLAFAMLALATLIFASVGGIVQPTADATIDEREMLQQHPHEIDVIPEDVTVDVPSNRPQPQRIDSVGGVHDLNAVTADQTIIGKDAYDYTGWTTATGDINGDGLDDMIMGAYYAKGPSNTNWGTGEVHITYACTKETIDLNNGDGDIVIYGEGYYNYFGYSLATGDIDNDGYDDLIIGAYRATGSYTYSGKVYVVFGGPSLPSVIDMSKNPAGVTHINGASTYSYLGSGAACGNVNNDAYDDIIFSAYGESSYRGCVYVIHGGTGVKGSTYNMNSASDYDTRIQGRSTYDYLGFQALTCADFDGDGFDDVAAGAYYNDGDGTISRSSCGAVYVFLGSSSGVYGGTQAVDLSSSDADVDFYGADSNDRIGTALGSGDMDGDGNYELLIGSRYANSYQGEMMMLWGSTIAGFSTPQTVDLNSFAVDFQMDGKGSYDYMGSSMTIGDVNGDGYGDLICGAYGADPQGRNYAGEVYVIFGNTSTFFPSDWDLSTKNPDFLVQGESNYYYTGSSVCVGNFDGDSQADILIGSYGASFGGRNYGGAGYIFLGQPPYMSLNEFRLLDGDGDDNKTFYADYDSYTFLVNVTDSWTLTDIKEIFLTIPVGMIGADLDYKVLLRWSRNHVTEVDTFEEVKDNSNLVEIQPDNCTVTNDGKNTWVVTFNIIIKMAFPYENSKNVNVLANGFGKLTDSGSFMEVFHVENDFVFLGELNVTAERQGVLESGGWVQTDEKMVFTGLKVAYEGTTDKFPSDNLYDVTIRDEEGKSYTDYESSGENFTINIWSSPYSDVSDFEIYISNITYSGNDMTETPVSFIILVDGDAPTPPLEIFMRADGFDDENMFFDNDTEGFFTWELSIDTGSGVYGYYYSLKNNGGTRDGTFTQGMNGTATFPGKGKAEIFIWAEDKVGNIGIAGNGTFTIDLDGVSFSGFSPSYDKWNTKSAVTTAITVEDEGGSGVEGKSIQYATSIDGGETFSDWKGAHLKDNDDEMDIEVVANFPDGKDNMIKFRAQDVAHNPYTESEAYELIVDTTPPVTLNYYPTSEDVFSSTLVQCNITIEDETSGINLESVQYSISTTGPDGFLGWTSAGLATDEYGTINYKIEYKTPKIVFLEGSNNYIKYRAKDIAGNSYAEFGPYQIKVSLPQANREPTAIIDAPIHESVYNTRDTVIFSANSSSDPDSLDVLSFYWVANGMFGLSSSNYFKRTFAKGDYIITLYVNDGMGHNVSTSISIKVEPAPEDLDTDGDGKMDDANGNGINDPGDDNDDDNDGLTDGDELALGTNPLLNDTDGDGVDDADDKYPLDYTRTGREVADSDDNTMLYVVLIIAVAALILVMVLAMVLVLAVKYKQAKDEERELEEERQKAKDEKMRLKKEASARRQQQAWATSKSGDVASEDVTKIAKKQADGRYSIPGVPGTYTMDQLKTAGLDYDKLMGYQAQQQGSQLPGSDPQLMSLPPGSEQPYKPHLPGQQAGQPPQQ